METHDYEYHQSGRTRSKVLRIVGHVFVGLIFAIAFALVFALLVQFIWNSLMPAIFDLKTITFWQAFGIIVLAKLLFGGFGHHDHRHQDHRDYYHWHKDRDNEERPPGRTSRNWKSYRQFWKDEGKQAFDAYVSRVEKQGGGESGGES